MKRRHTPERMEFETHYFHDARLTIPSLYRGYAKTEETNARRACVVRVDLEQYNKAVICKRDTLEVRGQAGQCRGGAASPPAKEPGP